MTDAEHIKGMIDNTFSNKFDSSKNELFEAVIEVLTKHYELPELLGLMEEKTSLMDVYDATRGYIESRRKMLADEEIKCDSVFERIQADSALDIMRGYDL